MTPPPAVSVVIPHYGDTAPTLALVHALLPQLADALAELIVSDDCSPTPFPTDIPHVRTVRRDANGGFGSAVNTGARVARGELLMILNSDLTVPADFVGRYLAAARPWLPAIVAPRIIEHGAGADSLRYFPRVSHIAAEWLTPLARTRGSRAWREAVGYDTAAAASEIPVAVDWAVGAALLLPRAAFAAVGGFDERFFMNSEEVDLARRLAERGVPTIFVPDVLVEHEGGGSSDPGRRRGWVVESRLRYFAKWGGVGRLRAALTAATAANLVWNATRRLRGVPVRPLAVARDELGYVWRRA